MIVRSGNPTDLRVTPRRRNPGLPATDTGWNLATHPPRSAPLSEPDAIAYQLEADRIAHEIELDAIRRRRLDALEQGVIQAVGTVSYYARRPRPASRLDLPDPKTVLARRQRRTRRVPANSPDVSTLAERVDTRPERGRKPASEMDRRAAARSYDAWARARSRTQPNRSDPLTASTGDPLRDDYRAISGAILNLQAAGEPVPQRLKKRRDDLLAEQRRRLTATRARRR